MLVLALDTCFARCAACLYDSAGGRIVAEEASDMERGHAEVLAPMVARLFEKNSIEKLERIAVTTGPGTFTGLRIALSFARAMGLARGVPVIGLDTLRSMRLEHGEQVTIAHQAGQSGFAYVLRKGASEIELVKVDDVPNDAVGTLHSPKQVPNLALLAAYAAQQPVPDAMPDPVYVREPDAKPQVRVRPVQAADCGAMAQIHQASFAKAWSPIELEDMLKVDGTTGFITETALGPASFLMARRVTDEAEILTIATKPENRKQGLARRMIEALQAEKAILRLFLEVASSNQPARSLYAKMGFVETGLRKSYYSDGDDAVLMTWIQI